MAIQSSEVVLDTKQMSLEKLKVRLHYCVKGLNPKLKSFHK